MNYSNKILSKKLTVEKDGTKLNQNKLFQSHHDNKSDTFFKNTLRCHLTEGKDMSKPFTDNPWWTQNISQHFSSTRFSHFITTQVTDTLTDATLLQNTKWKPRWKSLPLAVLRIKRHLLGTKWTQIKRLYLQRFYNFFCFFISSSDLFFFLYATSLSEKNWKSHE